MASKHTGMVEGRCLRLRGGYSSRTFFEMLSNDRAPQIAFALLPSGDVFTKCEVGDECPSLSTEFIDL